MKHRINHSTKINGRKQEKKVYNIAAEKKKRVRYNVTSVKGNGNRRSTPTKFSKNIIKKLNTEV